MITYSSYWIICFNYCSILRLVSPVTLTSAVAITKGVVNLVHQSVVVTTTIFRIPTPPIHNNMNSKTGDIIKVGVVTTTTPTHIILMTIMEDFIRILPKRTDHIMTDDHITCNHMIITFRLPAIVDITLTNDTMDGDDDFYIIVYAPTTQSHPLYLPCTLNFVLYSKSYFLEKKNTTQHAHY